MTRSPQVRDKSPRRTVVLLAPLDAGDRTIPAGRVVEGLASRFAGHQVRDATQRDVAICGSTIRLDADPAPDPALADPAPADPAAPSA